LATVVVGGLLSTSAALSVADAAPPTDDENLSSPATTSLSRLFAARVDRPTRQVLTKIKVIDGDTFTGVRPGRERRLIIRNAGIQAMEDRECGKRPAKRALSRLLGKRVVIVSQHNSENINGLGINRFQRNAFTRSGRDIQSAMIRTGLVLPYGIGRETLKQEIYATQAQRVALSGKGLWGGEYCRPGPVQEAQLQLMINYNASGRDRDNLQGKFVRVRNLSPVPVPIGRWRLRAAAHDSFYFPKGTVLAGNAEVMVRVGAGAPPSPGTFLWPGERLRFFLPGKSRYQGGGAYLFDRDGDIRAWSMYPCRVSCSHPAIGKVTASATPSRLVTAPATESPATQSLTAAATGGSAVTPSAGPSASALDTPSAGAPESPSSPATPSGPSTPSSTPSGPATPSTSPSPSASTTASPSPIDSETTAPTSTVPQTYWTDEFAAFQNRSSQRVDLSYTVVVIREQIHELPLGTYLDPGERLKVLMGVGVQDRRTHYLGVDEGYLFMDPTGGSVKLRTHTGIRIACTAWGDRTCDE
jgi:endonuclease YncB( thermonuclease family)